MQLSDIRFSLSNLYRIGISPFVSYKNFLDRVVKVGLPTSNARMTMLPLVLMLNIHCLKFIQDSLEEVTSFSSMSVSTKLGILSAVAGCISTLYVAYKSLG